MAPSVRRGRSGRRPRWLLIVFVALLVVPLVELAVIIAVGRVIGGWPTLALLLVESLIGAWFVRREGSRAWDALREALSTGQMPGRQLADAALVLVGGALLLTPGFVTDAVGFFIVLPLTRPLTRRWLEAAVTRRLLGNPGGPGGYGGPGGPRGGSGGGSGGPDDPDVVEGEVL